VFALIERYRATVCLHDMPGSATGTLAIGAFVYVRFHGTSRYSGSYSDGALEKWAEWLAGRATAGRAVFAFFNNDVGGHAPRDAARLRAKIIKRL
jgi:uncharacterized protein YecE (DUF72 family)